jgi:microcystin-dependent protein
LTIPGNLTVTGTIVSKGDVIIGEKDKSDGKITLINKQGGSGLYLSSNHDNQGGSIYLYAPANPEGKYDFKNHIHWDSSTLVVKGMVVAWSGDKVPEGWAMCDGQNNTPDLRGRFILSAGQGTGLTARVSKQVGGEENVTLSIAQMPAHTHTHNAYHANFHHKGGPTEGSAKPDCCGSFKVTSDPTGGNQPHNNMPPFYVLAYIIKV